MLQKIITRQITSVTGRKTSGLTRLIRKERWQSVRKHLETEKGRSDCLKQSDECTVLHLVCFYEPPVDVLELIVDLIPDALLGLDNSGRTPLHIAASMCAPLEIIRFLVERNKEAVSMVDNEGMTPLILLCKSVCSEVEEQPFYLDENISRQFWNEALTAASFLCASAPKHVVNIEDNEGKCALEHLITKNAAVGMVRFFMSRSRSARMIQVDSKGSEKAQLGFMEAPRRSLLVAAKTA